MTWWYSYDETAEQTTITWEGDDKTREETVDGKITRWRGGYPETPEARETVADMIQSAGTPDRIRMQFDLNYGFSEE